MRSKAKIQMCKSLGSEDQKSMNRMISSAGRQSYEPLLTFKEYVVVSFHEFVLQCTFREMLSWKQLPETRKLPCQTKTCITC